MNLPATDVTFLYWYWWIAGFGFLILEVFAPGAVFLWMGVSAFVLGGVALAVDLPWPVEVMLFGALSVASFFAYRRFKPGDVPTGEPRLNRRGDSYVGRRFALAEPIVNGVGRLRVDDSQWRISGADAPAGSTVCVTRADGATLHVERVG